MRHFAVVPLVCALALAQSSFVKMFGGGNDDVGCFAVQTSDGGYVIAGMTKSYGAGDWDVLVVKTDAHGDLQWQRTAGGVSADAVYCVRQTSDGGFVAVGYTASFGAGAQDVYLVKLDGSGNVTWQKTFGGADYDLGCSVRQTSDGGYAIAGITYSFGAGSSDAYLVKTDAAGHLQWQKTFGGSELDAAFSLYQTSDGGYMLAGQTQSFGADGQDVWYVRTDASGNQQWDQVINRSGDQNACSIEPTSDGGSVVGGWTSANDDDVYLLKLNASGNLQWEKTFGATMPDEALYAVQTSDGGYAVAGYTASFGAGQEDVYLLKLDGFGGLQWQQTFGGTSGDGAASVQQCTDHGYVLAGQTASFGSGGLDVYLLKTDASGSIGLADRPEAVCPWSLSVSPNPFAARTAIQYSLSRETDVSLQVYNSAGTVVVPLVRSRQERGRHTVRWGVGGKAAQLPTGTYFCRLEAGEFTSTLKIVKSN